MQIAQQEKYLEMDLGKQSGGGGSAGTGLMVDGTAPFLLIGCSSMSSMVTVESLVITNDPLDLSRSTAAGNSPVNARD